MRRHFDATRRAVLDAAARARQPAVRAPGRRAAVAPGILRKTTTIMECLHRFCTDCIQNCMRQGCATRRAGRASRARARARACQNASHAHAARTPRTPVRSAHARTPLARVAAHATEANRTRQFSGNGRFADRDEQRRRRIAAVVAGAGQQTRLSKHFVEAQAFRAARACVVCMCVRARR